MRPRRLRHPVLVSLPIAAIYPYRVPVSSRMMEAHSMALHTHPHSPDARAGDHPHGPEAQAIDPVCGMRVDPQTAKHRAEHAGRTYYFCAAGCRAKFIADPGKYLGDRKRAPPAAPEGALYTCPMHPEIRQVGPGSCPICGMALEPVLASADAGANPELRDMTQRFWIGLCLAVPVVVLEMGGHLIDLHRVLGATASNWLQLVLATP